MLSNFESIEQQITKGGEISPFLLLSHNLELLHGNVLSFLRELLGKNKIDMQSLFHLAYTGEALKIDEVKKFITQGSVRPRFAFQIFFIENISRMTTQSQNACLKFFEEPGEWNIVILTSESEAWILETILSRLQIIREHSPSLNKKNDFYLSMIESHIAKKSDELLKYFFAGKFEKSEYVDFLMTLLLFASRSPKYIWLCDEIEEDIGGILKNNLQGRYIIDKYIMKL